MLAIHGWTPGSSRAQAGSICITNHCPLNIERNLQTRSVKLGGMIFGRTACVKCRMGVYITLICRGREISILLASLSILARLKLVYTDCSLTTESSKTQVAGVQIMTARFCSECGLQLNVKRRVVLPFRALCPSCSPRFKTVRLVLAVFVVLAIVAFVLSRLESQREPFHFIGTPVESSANGGASTSSGSVQSPNSNERAVTPTTLVTRICGAPTRSGKPCQRKVKGGGYCWQHRDKPVERGSRPRND